MDLTKIFMLIKLLTDVLTVVANSAKGCVNETSETYPKQPK